MRLVQGLPQVPCYCLGPSWLIRLCVLVVMYGSVVLEFLTQPSPLQYLYIESADTSALA